MIDEISKIFGCDFDECTLAEALTHSSYAHENDCEDYQRLEFFGDSILSLCVVEMLFELYPGLSEGELSKKKAHLVSEKFVSMIARALGVGGFIRIGRAEKKAGCADNDSILTDATEALIAAAYRAGGLANARKMVEGMYEGHITSDQRDYKTILHEIVGAKKMVPEFHLESTLGSDHDKEFFIQVIIDGKICGSGKAKSKKEAQQLAAREALLSLKPEIRLYKNSRKLEEWLQEP